MLNTKLLLIIIALLASLAGFAAYRHRQEVARQQEGDQFWQQVETYRQQQSRQKPNAKATDALRYRVP
jgi:hypothetical protein